MVFNMSKSELKTATKYFAQVFKTDIKVAETDEVQAIIVNAPIELVEYDGTLQGEDEKIAQERRESFDIYDGKIDHLLKCLQEANPELRKLHKWELIFTIYQQISNPSKVIESAYNKLVMNAKPEDTPVMESNSIPSSNAEVIESPKHEETPSEPKTDKAVIAKEEEKVEVKEEVKVASTQQETKPVKQKQPKKNTDKTNNSFRPKEETKMANSIQDIVKSAAAIGAGTQGASNVAAGGDKEQLEALIAEQLGGSLEQRRNWNAQNFVTAVIVASKPAALRLSGDARGALSKDTDATEAAKKVKEKYVAFLSKISGRPISDVAEWKGLDDDTKYAAVADATDIPTINAAIDVFEGATNGDPTATFKAYIPDADKLNYSVKGYDLGGKLLSTDEFIKETIDNSIGLVYGIGSLTSDFKDAGDKPVKFKTVVANRTEKGTSKGVQSGSRKVDTYVVRPVNKREFLKDANHIDYIFNEMDPDNASTATFKAAVKNSAGEEVPATFTVYKMENGKRIPNGQDKDGNPKYKKMQAAVNLSVPVLKPIKQFPADYKPQNESDVAVAHRFGIQWSIKVEKKDEASVTDISQAPIFGLMQKAISSNMNLKKFSSSTTIATIKAAIKKQEETDAASVGEEL